MSHPERLLALAATLVLGTSAPALAAGVPHPAAASSLSAGGSPLAVLGYMPEWPGSGANQAFMAHPGDVTAIAPLWFTVSASGTIAALGRQNEAQLVAFAHRHHDRVLAMFTNAGGNDAILWNPLRDRVATAIRNIVLADHLDGVNIDFESLGPRDRTPLTLFVEAVRNRLGPLGRLTTVAVGPKTSTGAQGNPQGDAYNYQQLGAIASQVVIMTYDNHTPGSAPGPVAPMPWVRRCLGYALRRIPRKKILLGIADYGYQWNRQDQGPSLPAAQAEHVAAAQGVAIRWSTWADEPHFSFTGSGGSERVWFEDGQSMAFKIALAKADGLGGVALWALGGQDPAAWGALAFARR